MHCCANLKSAQSLEVFSYCLCRQWTTSVHCALQHALTPLSFDVTYHFVAELLLFPVASTLFYIPLTADCGIFSNKEILWMDL
ncbi:unnamed protein product, partial [Staurois parvus]